MRKGFFPGLLDALGAVLAGNALYFLFLFPRLSEPWQHKPFAVDRGLFLDFLLCLAAFVLARAGRAWFDARAGRR